MLFYSPFYNPIFKCENTMICLVSCADLWPRPSDHAGERPKLPNTTAMFLKTSFSTLVVGVFMVYVLHTCWVMYEIVYTKPCDNPKGGNCITPFLAGNPKLQVSEAEADKKQGFDFHYRVVCVFEWFGQTSR